jgi:uncharacterized FlaG/YvyC family protein
MATIPPPKLDARLTSVMRVDAQLQKPEIEPRSRRSAPLGETEVSEALAQNREHLAPGRLLVQIDVESGRFVNTLLDAATEEVIRKYPSEAQLAYSRAVKAYLNALAGS